MSVKSFFTLAFGLCTLLSCVDPDDLILRGTVDILIVDGTITNLPEPQVIRISRSRSDPLTGRFGVLPITKAVVNVVVDSTLVIDCHETVAGTYQLPSDFKGQTGHAYQLQFTLSNGKRYTSNQQVMPTVAPIERALVMFNSTSLPTGLYPNNFRSGYDIILSIQDPPNQRNRYRWDWLLYEKQKWCRSCYQTVYVDSTRQGYIQNGVYVTVKKAIEDCVEPAVKPNGDFYNDYTCRTSCWQIIRNYTLNLFDDQLTNGSMLIGRTVAQVPLFTRQPALIVLRQLSLTPDAYRYFALFQQQTQNTGGLADTPPTALSGNIHNQANSRESVVGFFSASTVATHRTWLDKKDATTLPIGAYDDRGNIVQSDDELFYALNQRQPTPGSGGPPFSAGQPDRLITAPCIPGDDRTPFKPDGWQE